MSECLFRRVHSRGVNISIDENPTHSKTQNHIPGAQVRPRKEIIPNPKTIFEMFLDSIHHKIIIE